MAIRKSITAVFLYVVAFLVSIRFFVKGEHECAWMLMLGAFVLALVHVVRARRS